MSILQYYKRVSSTYPTPNGPLSRSIPSAAIASANREISQMLATNTSQSRKRGPYHKFSPRERAVIGKYAAESGVLAAKRKFSQKLGKNISENTIRGFKVCYETELSRKRSAGEDLSVKVLPPNKRGRPLMLGEKLDFMVQKYILKTRENGGTINTDIVISVAMGILKALDRTRLAEYGGPATLTKSWGKLLLKRMHFTKRRGTTKYRMPVEEFKNIWSAFLQEVIDIVEMENIPSELIFKWDQTGLNLVPAANWTMDRKGSKRIEIKGLNDKRQITAVFCGTLIGEFMPIQLIYGGKTDRCHPRYPFPPDWHITHSENHWSNEQTMLNYIDKIIVPFVERVREDLGLDKQQAALAIFDHFKGQLTESITQVLEKHNIQSVLVPACCTDRLQPLDISVNKSAKSFLRSEFQKWYANEIGLQLTTASNEELEPVDLSTAKMKSVGAQWLVRLDEYISESPDIIVNGFIASGIPQSIDAGMPIVNEDSSDSDDSTSTSEDSEDSDDCDSSDND